MEQLVFFFGRFHPLIIHFPIALLLVAFLFEILSRKKKVHHLDFTIRSLLFIAFMTALFSSFSGWALSSEGGYANDDLIKHRWGGISTTVLSALLFILKSNIRNGKKLNSRFIILIFTLSSLSLVLTAHWGASMTHGKAFLSEYAPWNRNQADVYELPQIADIDTAIFYTHLIDPIFHKYCYQCHSVQRKRGGLRLDGQEWIAQGGKSGSILTTGKPDSSILYNNLYLPIDADMHMPPSDYEQLSSAEIGIIYEWINSGASFTGRVGELKINEKIADYWHLITQPEVTTSWLPDQPVEAADSSILRSLRLSSVIVNRISEESNYLDIDFINQPEITDGIFGLLLRLADQIIVLDLSRTNINEYGMDSLSRLYNLRILKLDYTGINDKELIKLVELTHLENLHLLQAQISEKGLDVMSKMPSLKKVYLFDSSINESQITEFANSHPELSIEYGRYNLEKLPSDTIIY